jgi:hypothetical protein
VARHGKQNGIAMLLALALALATSVGPGAAAPAGVVRGQVRSESTGAPLALAVVEVLELATPIRVITDSVGEYVLRRVPAGRHIIRATHFDHAPFEVEVLVPPGGDMSIDLSLALRPVALPAVLARARVRDAVDTGTASASDLSAASMRLLGSSPGVAELGLAQAARGVPGGSQAPDPSEILYVRGGAADLKLVLLDGAPVYAPFHVGGLLTPFDADVIRSATLYLGGAPARYDGGLSYVLDMRTRSPRRDATHTTGAVDMLSAQAVVDGPLPGPVDYMVAVRGVHDFAALPMLDRPFPYSYGDGLARMDVDLGGGRSLRATGFYNREAVRLDTDGAVAGSSAHWGNSAASVHYHGQIAGADGEIMAAVGEFDAVLPVGGVRPMLADGTSRRMRVAADFSESAGGAQLYWGASYDRLSLDYFGWALSHPDSLVMNTDAGGNALGAYVDAGVQPLHRLRLRGGTRVDFFAGETAPRVGPRLSATWVVGPHSLITLAAGQYHQYLRATETAVVSAGGEPSAQKIPPLSVAQASHVVLSLDQEVAEGMRVGIEGYLKSFRGIPSSDGAAPGPARASGVDLWLRRGTGRVTGWLGYSLAWVSAPEGALDATELFSGRQTVSTGVSTPMVGGSHLDVRVSYGSGMPFTAVPQPDRPPPAEPTTSGGHAAIGDLAPLPTPAPVSTASAPGPDDPYVRVDAQLARSFSGAYRGVAFELTPYLRVLNALDSRDALFYQLDRTQNGKLQAVAALPVLPILGFSWRF